MNGGAVVAPTDIDKGAIADRKRAAGGERQRGLYRPAGSQLFVVIDRNTRTLVAAGGDDAGVINRSSVEP